MLVTLRTFALPLVLLLALLALAAIIVLPDPRSFSQNRPIAFGVVLGAGASVIAAILQTWEANRSRRLEVLRGAYRSMIGATQAMLDQQRELVNFPFGHPYPGVVSSFNTPADYYRHDPFEEAKSLEAEWRRRYAEGERELLLEADRNDEVLVAWRQVRKSFFAWVRRLQVVTTEAQERAEASKERFAFDIDDDGELPGLDQQLRTDIDAFAAICRRRIKAVR